MTKEIREIWFPAKEYGWGWGMPCAWQGCVVMVVYIGIVLGATIVMQPTRGGNMKLYLIVVIISSLLFCLVCWRKGEKPAWKWGDKK